MTVENTNTATEAGLLFSYYIVLSFWAAQGLGMSLLSRNVAGQTKKSVAVTMNFVAWAAGNAIGKFVFLLFLSTPRVQEKKRKRKETSNISPQTQTHQVPKSSSPGIPLATSSPSPLT